MYRFEIAGVKIECDDVSELREVLGNGHAPKTRKVVPAGDVTLAAPRKKKQHGAAKSWKAARKLSKEKGISVVEARAQIASAKK